jgi:uncharacterized protein HemX
MATLDSITTVIVTVVTVLFSAGAWKFYEVKMKLKAKNTEDQKNDHNMYRDDLRDRVKRLEQLLQQSSEEKDEMRNQILSLTKEISELRVKVTFLEKENERLKNI